MFWGDWRHKPHYPDDSSFDYEEESSQNVVLENPIMLAPSLGVIPRPLPHKRQLTISFKEGIGKVAHAWKMKFASEGKRGKSG